MTIATIRQRLRARAFATLTAVGAAKLGFFSPHRHAAHARAADYPAYEPHFINAEPAMRDLMAEIDSHTDTLLRLNGPAPEPRFDQDWFPRLDAAAAYAMVHAHWPKIVIEVGSGHSTRFLVRAARDAGLKTRFICIDPAPRASLSGTDVMHVPRLLQDLTPHDLPVLGRGDMLVIDSSHISMPGSDVDRLFGDILPRLVSGVLVHVHDVVLPDAYPADWEWRGYNEQLLVGGLLEGAYRLLWSSHWVATRRPRWLKNTVVERLALAEGVLESSVWMQKR